MTLPALLTHVAARWAVTRTPTCGWVPDESETEMNNNPTVIYTPTQEAGAFNAATLINLLRPHALTCDVRMSTDDKGLVTEVRAYCAAEHGYDHQEEA